MRIPRVVVGVVSWLVVVAVGSTLVWSVISRAGEGLTSEAAPPVPAASTPSAPTARRRTGSRPAARRRATASAPPAAPAARQATWRGAGGEVVAQCRAGVVTLVSATPDPGFRAEVGGSGSSELEVELEGREEQSGSKVKVRASCLRGLPQFSVEVETDDADRD